MFKWLGQVHIVFAKHSNWLVKVASAFVVAFGGITGLNWRDTQFILWLCDSPCPSSQVRLQILDKTLEFKKTLLAEKERAFFTRIIRIGLLGSCNPKNSPKNVELRGFLYENINTHKSVIQSKKNSTHVHQDFPFGKCKSEAPRRRSNRISSMKGKARRSSPL